MRRAALETWLLLCRRAEESEARAASGRLAAARRSEARAARLLGWTPPDGAPAAGLLALASAAGRRALEDSVREREQAREAARALAAARAARRAAEELLRRREDEARLGLERRAQAEADDGSLSRWALRRERQGEA